MPAPRVKRDWGPEFDRLARGELASSTEARLRELTGWGGASSFLEPSALALAADAGIEPVGQVVGLSAGLITPGYLRTTRPGQGRPRLGAPRWREHSGPPIAWASLRRRALARLSAQASRLDADAVVGIVADRRHEAGTEEGGFGNGQVTFTGTAVRIPSWRPVGAPVLTLASAAELWAMERAGVRPAGIAGAYAGVETSVGSGTLQASWGRRAPNVELDDLTRSMYELRRLAMQRLATEARELKADGLLGVDFALEERGRGRIPGAVSVHVLASAVRRTGRRRLHPDAIATGAAR